MCETMESSIGFLVTLNDGTDLELEVPLEPGEKVVECCECLTLNVISSFEEVCYGCNKSLTDCVIKFS